MLRSSLRELRRSREALEELALAVPQPVSQQLIEQISTFLLAEDELRTEGVETRKSCN